MAVAQTEGIVQSNLRVYIDKIKNNPDHRRLFENFASLSVLQVLNYILPIITFPYIVRVLGVEKFGLLAFAYATIGYFQIITDYGFDLSATREIAIHRYDKSKVQEIYSSVMTIKFGLMLLSLLFLTILVFSFEKFKQDLEVYFLTFIIVVGNILFPMWFFQGMERMKYITYFNILAKGLFTVAIFIFVREQADYWKVPLLHGLALVLAGILSLFLICKYFDIKIKLPSILQIKCQLKSGWHIFISTIAISLYTVSTTFILGLFTNNVIVGYYSAADRIVQAVKGLMTPVSQSLYPFISKKINESFNSGLYIIRKAFKYIAIFTGLISLCLLVFSYEIIYLVLGDGYTDSVYILMILSIHPFLIGLSNIFGIQTMLSLGKNKAFQNILVTASILNLVLSVVLIPYLKHIGSAISVTLVEFFVTTSMLIYLQMKGIKILSFKNV